MISALQILFRTVGGVVWDWLTRDEFEEFIAEQKARFAAMHEGE